MSTSSSLSKRIVARRHILLNEYLNISEPSTAPEAGAWWGGQESPGLLKNFQLFHQVSEDSQHLFDFISRGLHGLWGSQRCSSTLCVAQAAPQTDSNRPCLTAFHIVVFHLWLSGNDSNQTILVCSHGGPEEYDMMCKNSEIRGKLRSKRVWTLRVGFEHTSRRGLETLEFYSAILTTNACNRNMVNIWRHSDTLCNELAPYTWHPELRSHTEWTGQTDTKVMPLKYTHSPSSKHFTKYVTFEYFLKYQA